MKKFRIDENERERILNMHIKATQNQYLSESIISEQPYFLSPQETFQIQSGLNDYFKKKGVKSACYRTKRVFFIYLSVEQKAKPCPNNCERVKRSVL